MKIVFVVALLLFYCFGLAQPLSRYPMMGVSGGVGLPLALKEPSKGVARGITTVSRGVTISVPFSRSIFNQYPELFLEGILVDQVTDYQLEADRWRGDLKSMRLLSPSIVANLHMAWRVWASDPSLNSHSLWSVKLGPTLGTRLTYLEEITSCMALSDGIPLLTSCGPENPDRYAWQQNEGGFFINAGATGMLDYTFTSRNDFFTGRVGLMASYYPFKVDQYRVTVLHKTMPYDGLVRWNRSSAELFFQFHLNGKMVRNYLIGNPDRFTNEPRA